MDWLMLAFLGILVLLLAYYLFRQRKDPGVKVFPFNQVNFQAGSPPEGEGGQGCRLEGKDRFCLT